MYKTHYIRLFNPRIHLKWTRLTKSYSLIFLRVEILFATVMLPYISPPTLSNESLQYQAISNVI